MPLDLSGTPVFPKIPRPRLQTEYESSHVAVYCFHRTSAPLGLIEAASVPRHRQDGVEIIFFCQTDSLPYLCRRYGVKREVFRRLELL